VTFAVSRKLVSAGNSDVTIAPSTIPDNGTSASVVTVVVKDTDGTVAVGIPAASVVVSASGAGNTVTQPVSATDVAGTTDGSVVSTTAASKTISAAVMGLTLTDQPTLVVEGETGDPFFEDAFTGPARTDAGGFVWQNGASLTPTPVNSEGSDCLRFRFGPDADLEDTNVEQRFELGRNVTELWIHYRMFYPSNYVHRNQSSGGTNNKFLRIWGDDYAANNKYGFSTWYSATSPTGSSIRGDRRTDSGMGPSAGGGSNTVSPTVDFPVTLDDWTDVKIHLLLNTSYVANDGVQQVWFDDVLTFDWDDLNAFYTAATAYWNAGYLLGSSSSGFASETDILIDDVKFYDTLPAGWPA
jgi:hypothetical protein